MQVCAIRNQVLALNSTELNSHRCCCFLSHYFYRSGSVPSLIDFISSGSFIPAAFASAIAVAVAFALGQPFNFLWFMRYVLQVKYCPCSSSPSSPSIALDMCTCVWAHPVCRMQCWKNRKRARESERERHNNKNTPHTRPKDTDTKIQV